ncbi:MAG: tetratricopeptide repeat protein [Candidatus Ratteibacteria bacterium]|nr:tetratricopeptide repeat protein [Candidatus Ratteibacteria bacterium]
MDAEELLDIGLTHQLKGQLEKAEDCLKKALAEDPKIRGAHLGLGDIYMKQGQFDAAEEMYKKEIEVNPASAKSYIELANVNIIKGNEDESLSNFEKALSLSSNDWRACKGMGYVYFVRGELAKAVGWLKMANDGNAQDLAVHFWIALIYFQNGLVTETDAEIERVRAICQNIEKFTSKQEPVIAYVLGKVAAIQGKYKETVKYLEDLRKKINIKNRKRVELGLIYDETDILKTLAEAYDKSGDKGSASSIQKEIANLTVL